MTRCKTILSLVALVVPFAVGATLLSTSSTPAMASTTSTDFCAGTGSKFEWQTSTEGCVYSPPTAAAFDGEVCWNGVSARAKGAGACLTTELQYHLQHGEVIDPLTGLVAAYAPVPDACDVLLDGCGEYQGVEELVDGYACCNPKTGDCFAPDENGDCTVGEVTWCKDLEDNGEGGVNCHE